MQHSIVIQMKQFCHETVAKVNSLHTGLSRACQAYIVRASNSEDRLWSYSLS